MVNIMGYFDDAIAEREESLEHGDFSGSDIIELSEEEYLEHGRFGSFRKTHKYIDRVWKHGRWVYRYKITGKGYKDRYRKYEAAADSDARKLWGESHDNDDWSPTKGSRGLEQFHNDSDRRDKAESDYYNKSLAGKIDKAMKYDRFDQEDLMKRKTESAASKVKDFFTPKETATVKDTMTGKTKSVDPNDAIYKKLEKEAKKSKKFKHDDEDGEIMTYFPARDENSLEHHGILGQKWGIRRFQNADGSLTAEGRRRVYGDQGQYYGGYESFRNRHRRAIDAAKYEKDIAKNQKKLDKAYDKGNEKKIAKYTQIDKALKNNRDIMTRDLSPEAIQMGRDYITQMKAGMIGTLIAGPIGGAAAGLGVRYANKMQETEKKVYAQEAERRKLGDNVKAATKELNDWEKANGSKAYEGENAKITDRLTDNWMRAKDDLHNYNVEQQRRAGGKPGAKVFRDSDGGESSSQAIAKKASLEKAKSTGQYSLDFLEAVQNSKILSQGNDKALLKEYEKYLNDPDDYWKNGRNKLEED